MPRPTAATVRVGEEDRHRHSEPRSIREGYDPDIRASTLRRPARRHIGVRKRRFRMNHRWKILPVTMGLALVLAACGGGESPAASTGASGAPSDGGEPQAGGTLVFAGAALADSLDPFQTSDGESFRILQQVYEPLVDLQPGTTSELVGVLAESWEGEAADTTYVFHLREGVTFQDGTPLNAEAVKTNFDRWANAPEELQANAYYYQQ